MINEYKLSIDGEKNIEDNFKIKEFACKDGSDKILIDKDLVEDLQGIRNVYDEPIKIISGYRTEDYNNKCGGAKTSKHLLGGAIDFTCDRMIKDIFEIAIFSEYTLFLKGIGVYINRDIPFIHIDNRKEKIVWINDQKSKTQKYYNNIIDFLTNKQPIKTISL